jgi:hypothetical protein
MACGDGSAGLSGTGVYECWCSSTDDDVCTLDGVCVIVYV